MIEAWLANKLAAPILLGLAILLAVGLVVQTVRINGISFFGLYAVDGYKPMYQRAALDIGTLRTNQENLVYAVKICNASVDGLKSAGDLLTAKAQGLADIAKGLQGQLTNNIAAMRAIQSTGEKCPVADAILMRAFQ